MNNFEDFGLVLPLLALSLPCIILGFFINAIVYINNSYEFAKQQIIINQCTQYNSIIDKFEWFKK